MYPRDEIGENWRDLSSTDLAWRLESHLIEDWDSIQDAPEQIKEIIEADPMSHGGPVAIGRNQYTGWFILASGQGPFVLWTENK